MSRAWMPLYVGDYLRDTRDLTTLQHGAYLLLIMHYWQHDGLPRDNARLAAIAGLTLAQWRRNREALRAKFGKGWVHKRIDAELARADRVYMQRRQAGQNGGIRAKRTLRRMGSAGEAHGLPPPQPPATHHNQNRISSSLPAASQPNAAKPASQWSRQELDALFARRKLGAQQPTNEGD
jgi:uncharacterized protein YdaU (DUF1376 family)